MLLLEAFRTLPEDKRKAVLLFFFYVMSSYEIYTCLRNRIPRLYEHAAEVLPAADLAKLEPATLL